MKNRVVIVKYNQPIKFLAKVISLSGALDQLKRGDQVFIKPNIVFWSRRAPMPPWGVITTSRVVEDVVRQLKARGAGKIIIGEGTITSDPQDTRTAAHAFETLGYNKISRRYGVKVVNLFVSFSNQYEH